MKIVFPNNTSPSVSLWLLNNGWCPQAQGVAPTYFGYEAQIANIGGSLALIINRTNPDGSVTNLYTNSASPYGNVNLAQWSTMSAKVNVKSTATDLTLQWDGVSSNGMPVSYSCTVSDTSALRWTGGAGIGVRGYPGARSDGLIIDDLKVIGDYVGIKNSKAAPENSPVSLNNVIITKSFSSFFYVESDDRTYGIRVNWPNNRLTAGTRVNVTGIATTSTDGERCIDTSTLPTNVGSGSVAALGMINRSLGGSNWFYDPMRGTGQQGVAGGTGPCNIGLLVRTTGEVLSQSDSEFTMTDGSGQALRVNMATGASGVVIGSYVKVTGVSSCVRASDGSLVPLLRVRYSSDVQQILQP